MVHIKITLVNSFGEKSYSQTAMIYPPDEQEEPVEPQIDQPTSDT